MAKGTWGFVEGHGVAIKDLNPVIPGESDECGVRAQDTEGLDCVVKDTEDLDCVVDIAGPGCVAVDILSRGGIEALVESHDHRETFVVQ